MTENPVKQAKAVFVLFVCLFTHIKGISCGLQVWMDPGTEAVLVSLPPYSALFLSVSLLGSIIFFPCFGQLPSPRLTYGASAQDCILIDWRGKPLSTASTGRKEGPHLESLPLVARATGILIDNSIQTARVRVEFPRDRGKGE